LLNLGPEPTNESGCALARATVQKQDRERGKGNEKDLTGTETTAGDIRRNDETGTGKEKEKRKEKKKERKKGKKGKEKKKERKKGRDNHTSPSASNI
jgi:hypothetical protein